ncbi:MAG: hypothetical protein WBM34_12910, partial [Woeseiaceae bacterium]
VTDIAADGAFGNYSDVHLLLRPGLPIIARSNHSGIVFFTIQWPSFGPVFEYRLPGSPFTHSTTDVP